MIEEVKVVKTWKDGRVEEWNVGKMEPWKNEIIRLFGNSAMEEWKVGMMERWKNETIRPPISFRAAIEEMYESESFLRSVSDCQLATSDFRLPTSLN